MQFHYLQPLAIVWKEDGQSKWYLGFCIAGTHKDRCILIDHLTGDDSEWTQPRKDEVLEVYLDPILPMTVKGDWVIVAVGSGRSTSMKFAGENWKEIEEKKKELEMKLKKTNN